MGYCGMAHVKPTWRWMAGFTAVPEKLTNVT